MFPGNIPNRMAGWAQERAGTSLPEWGGPWDFPPSSFGDDPEDQYWINEGIKDFNDGYFDLDGEYNSDCPKGE